MGTQTPDNQAKAIAPVALVYYSAELLLWMMKPVLAMEEEAARVFGTILCPQDSGGAIHLPSLASDRVTAHMSKPGEHVSIGPLQVFPTPAQVSHSREAPKTRENKKVQSDCVYFVVYVCLSLLNVCIPPFIKSVSGEFRKFDISKCTRRKPIRGSPEGC